MAVRIPILRLKGILLTSIQVDLADQEALEFQSDLVQEVTRSEAQGVVIDVTALDVVDSFMARVLNETASMAQTLGAEVVLCGIQPSVALTLTEMGRELIGVETALSLEQGVEKLDRLLAQRGQRHARNGD
jgi:rsbT antagonist protein RsbS